MMLLGSLLAVERRQLLPRLTDPCAQAHVHVFHPASPMEWVGSPPQRHGLKGRNLRWLPKRRALNFDFKRLAGTRAQGRPKTMNYPVAVQAVTTRATSASA